MSRTDTPTHGLIDLCGAREAMRAGRASAPAYLAQSHEMSRSPSCEHAFISTSYDTAAQVAALPSIQDSMLAGVAVSVKDLFDVEGEATRACAAVLEHAQPAARDCVAVARLRAAGAAFVGRTHMSEFAFSAVGINPHLPTPRNVADAVVPRIPGGSSSGAAISVASGAAFVGLGSDTGGSIRTPAALNGIVGFKSTARRVPLTGVYPLAPSLDTVGAMTRSVRDAIVVHEVLAARVVARDRLAPNARRIGVPRTLMLDGLDATVSAAFDATLSRLSAHGFRIEELDLPVIQDLGWLQSRGGIAAFEAFDSHRDRIEQDGDRYDPRVLARILKGKAMTDRDYIDLLRARREWMEIAESMTSGFDALLSPTVPVVAPPIAEVAPGAERDERFFAVNALMVRNTSVVNQLDGCAVTLPCHASEQLPVGMMVWHGCMRDDGVLCVAAQIESVLKPELTFRAK